MVSSFLPTSTSPHPYHTQSANSLCRLGSRFHPNLCYVTYHLPLFGKGHKTQQVVTKSGVNWNMCCAQVRNKKGLIDIRKIQPYVDVCLRICVYMGNVVYTTRLHLNEISYFSPPPLPTHPLLIYPHVILVTCSLMPAHGWAWPAEPDK